MDGRGRKGPNQRLERVGSGLVDETLGGRTPTRCRSIECRASTDRQTVMNSRCTEYQYQGDEKKHWSHTSSLASRALQHRDPDPSA